MLVNESDNRVIGNIFVFAIKIADRKEKHYFFSVEVSDSYKFPELN